MKTLLTITLLCTAGLSFISGLPTEEQKPPLQDLGQGKSFRDDRAILIPPGSDLTRDGLSSLMINGAYDGICGIRRNSVPDIITRIVGGAPAEEHEFPWQVSLQWRYHFYTYHVCGAAIINKDWVITAAHCTHQFTPTDLLIVAGDHHLKDKEGVEQTRNIQRIVEHEAYDANTQENDIALIKMTQSLSINGMSVSPVCLPPSGWEYSGDCVVTGWGKLSEGGRSADELQKVIVPIISNEECIESYRAIGYTGPIADTMICAGYEFGGKDACQGDSGGPFVCRGTDNRYFLGGIVSWGVGCARPNVPGVYTEVSHYIEWINEVVNERHEIRQRPANLRHGSLEEPTESPIIKETFFVSK